MNQFLIQYARNDCRTTGGSIDSSSHSYVEVVGDDFPRSGGHGLTIGGIAMTPPRQYNHASPAIFRGFLVE
jgi:hypothetical protein